MLLSLPPSYLHGFSIGNTLNLGDIQNRTDIEFVVREQYRQLLEDSFTAPGFRHLNLEVHLPKIFVFWCFVLDIEAENNLYSGSAFEPHVKLNLTEEHFKKWLNYLHTTIRRYFQGPNADHWVSKSDQFGIMFMYKLGIHNDDSFLIGKK